MSCARGCCATQAEHFRSVAIGTSVLVEGNRKDRELAKDLDAYQRLVRSGVQPRSTVGAARVEATANTKAQAEGVPDAAARIGLGS